MPQISVIIPTYNRAILLMESIRSVLDQSRPVQEIIVVDDGSTDQTRSMVSSLSGPIHYFYQENRGKAAALNLGLSRSSYEYIWICDDDDIALPNAAKLLSSALQRDDIGFSFGRYRRFSVNSDSGEKSVFDPAYWPNLQEKSVFLSLLEECFIFHNACMVRKRAYDAVGPFREDLIRSQDYEMAIRLADKYQSQFVPEVLFLQRTHQGHRGSSHDRFDPNAQLVKWLQYDTIFFRELHKSLTLSKFAPVVPDGTRGDIKIRAALLQRACVFARKKLWDLSLVDLRKAISTAPSEGLTLVERRICQRFLLSKYGCDEIVTRPEIAETLLSLAQQSDLALSAIQAVTSPLVWHFRRSVSERNFGLGQGFARLLVSIHGWQGIASLLWSKAKGHISEIV